MSKIIILNGGSCSGKSTIAKEICRQPGDKFVHLGIDEFKRFLFTIVNHNNVVSSGAKNLQSHAYYHRKSFS